MPLLEYPTYLINLDSKPDRLEYASTNLTQAGFTDVRRFRAVEPSTMMDNMIDTITFHPPRTHREPICCSLSHLRVWKRILEEGHDRAVVCEDDLYFVDDWDTQHREYYSETPDDYGFIFIGSGISSVQDSMGKILTNYPTVCMHCYVITRAFIEDFFSREHCDIPILDVYMSSITQDSEIKMYTWINKTTNLNIKEDERYMKMSQNMKFNGLALQNEEYYTSLNTLDSFINSYSGYIEGHTRQVPEYMEKLREVLSIANPKNILEIGFNIGCSSDSFLSMFKDCRVTSVDIGEHPYVIGAKNVIDGNYFHRHKLILGDSTQIIPLIDSSNKFDFIFIDGGHYGNIPFIDLENCKRLAHDKTIVVMDDTVVQPEFVEQYNICPIRAWKDGVKNGLIKELGSVDFAVGRGFSWGKYCL